MIIPISHESSSVRRLPWISFFIMALCVVIHIIISVEIVNSAEELEKNAKELINYYIKHPYLKIDAETKKLIFGDRTKEDVDKMLGVYRKNRSRRIRLFQVEEQEQLDAMAKKLKETIDNVPYRKYGYIPAKKNLMGLVTYMFIHGGWLHLLGNLLLLYLTGPFIEDVWGRPFFIAFYIIAGVVSGFMFSLYSPHFTGPLIGASGAIAGLMGVFLIRYWNTKIKFWFFFFLFHGTFKAPAWLMLPIWLALEIFSANRIDSVNPDGGGVAHWAHVWGFLFGVVVASLMKRFKVEEKYIHPKIDAQVHYVDEGYKAFEDAKQKINEGNAEEAYAVLLGAAQKNPMNRDVVEGLWNQGKELGKEKEAEPFFKRLIESEIRRDQMDVAFIHFMELREKIPQASLSMTCKFMLMKYLTERQDYKEAKELTAELVKDIDLNSSPVLLQDFARVASEHSPEVAKKITEMCLQHEGIADFQKDALRARLKELENIIQAAPAQSDVGQAESAAAEHAAKTMGGEFREPGSVAGSEHEVKPLADSVGQTREELIGQVDANPETEPAVVTDMKYKTQPDGQPPAKPRVDPLGKPPEVKPEVEPEVQAPVVTDMQYKTQPEGQPAVESESQPAPKPEDQPKVAPEGQPEAQPEIQPLGESIGQAEVGPEVKPEVGEERSADAEPQGDPFSKPEEQPRETPEIQPKPVPEVQPEAKPERRPGTVESENQFAAKPEVNPLADSVGQTKEELVGQMGVTPESKSAEVTDMQYKTQSEGKSAVETENISEPKPESQPEVAPPVQPEVEPDKSEENAPPNQSIMAIKATPLNLKEGKIQLDMDQIGQQLLPLTEVKSIALVEITPDKGQPYLLIDLFLDDPKANNNQVRTIRLLSTGFDATRFSPGVQDQQDALKVFVSVLLKLSGATAYPDQESIMDGSPKSFLSIEAYEKSVLS